MRVIVTGGAGFIGSHTADALLERGDEVIILDDLSTGHEENLNPRARLERVDIRAPEAQDVIREMRPQGVVHLAAQASVSLSVREPQFDATVNVMGSLNLMIAAAEVGARFVFSSTGGAIYGDTPNLPTREDEPAWPVSPYGISKLAAEHYLHGFAAQHGLPYTVLRYSNVYGPRQDPHGEAGVVAIFSRALLEDRPCLIHGAGTDTRDYVYVGDVVRANLLALNSEGSAHYNVGTGRRVDVNTLFGLIASAIGSDREAEHGPPRAGDLRASALDASRITHELGWRPEVDLERGLHETVAWFRAAIAV